MFKHKFKEGFRFITYMEGEELIVRDAVLSIEAPVCKIEGIVSFNDYDDAAQSGWFNVEEDYILPMESGLLVVGKEVKLEMVLQPALYEMITVAGEAPEQIVNYINSALVHGMKMEFLNEENWYCTEVTQQSGGKTVGVRTLWALAKFNQYQKAEDWETILSDASNAFMKVSFLSSTGVNINVDDIKDSNGNGNGNGKDDSLEDLNMMTKALNDMMGGDPDKIQGMMSEMFKDDTFMKMTEDMGMKGMMDSFMGAGNEEEGGEEYEGDDDEYLEEISLVEAITDFLEEDDWDYAINEQETELRLEHNPVDDEKASYKCLGHINEEQETFIFHTKYPAFVPKSKYGSIAELIIRINANCNLGNLTMDFDTGNVSFRTGVDASSAIITPELMSNVILENVNKAELIFPYINGFLKGTNSIAQIMMDLEDVLD